MPQIEKRRFGLYIPRVGFGYGTERISDLDIAQRQKYIHHQLEGRVNQRFNPRILFLGRNKSDVDIRIGIQFLSSIAAGSYDRKP